MSEVEAIPQPGPSRIRQAAEVIDVDALPDEVVAGPSTSTRRSQSITLISSHAMRRSSPGRGQRPIYVADSDEEGVSSPRAGASRNRLTSPAHPIIPHQHILTAPGTPNRLRRHRSRSYHAPVIPHHAPFAFEAQLAHRPPTPPPQVLPPRGAPRSQHQPAMGLGGALITWNRRETEMRQNAQQALQNPGFRPFGAIADTIMHYFGTRPDPHPGHAVYEDFGDFMDMWGDDPWDAEWLPEARRQGRDGRKEATNAPAWIPSYTHPGEPEPGFTFHFDTKVSKTPPRSVIVINDDGEVFEKDNSPASAEPSPTLVCARCLEPLVVPAEDGPELSAEEAKKCRVWALRCGHMLDGKCIEEIMRPEPVIEHSAAQDTDERPAKRSRVDSKGKAVAVPPDTKGKGKAVERGQPAGDLPPVTLVPEDTSMRARLRPRGNRNTSSVFTSNVSSTSDTSTVAHNIPSSSRPTRPLPRRGTNGAGSSPSKPKAKAQGRARKPVVEAKHAWFCPVAGCCKEHGSIRMRGEEQWKMDSDIGAIALYV